MIHNSTQSDLRQKVRNLKTIKKKKQRNVENEEKWKIEMRGLHTKNREGFVKYGRGKVPQVKWVGQKGGFT